MNTSEIILTVHLIGVVFTFVVIMIIKQPDKILFENRSMHWFLISIFWPFTIAIPVFILLVLFIPDIIWLLIFGINWKKFFLKFTGQWKSLTPKNATYGIHSFEDRKHGIM